MKVYKWLDVNFHKLAAIVFVYNFIKPLGKTYVRVFSDPSACPQAKYINRILNISTLSEKRVRFCYAVEIDRIRRERVKTDWIDMRNGHFK